MRSSEVRVLETEERRQGVLGQLGWEDFWGLWNTGWGGQECCA